MEIKLYTFSKRTNSTKRPTGGTSFVVRLKERTDIYNPTFLLAENITQVKGYNYATYDNLYYYIENAVSAGNNLTEISCRLDSAATLKTEIGNTHGFCVYGANGNYKKVDPRISLKQAKDIGFKALSTTWGTSGSTSWNYYMTVGGDTGQRIYIMNYQELSQFMTDLASAASSVGQQIQNQYGNIYGPLNNITACPISVPDVDGVDVITLAGWTSSNSYRYINPAGAKGRQLVCTVSGSNSMTSPAGGFDFLLYPPFSSYSVFLPYYGQVGLNEMYMDELTTGASISVEAQASFDVSSCSLTWKVMPGTLEGRTWAGESMMEIYSASLGVDMGVTQNTSNKARNIFNAIKDVTALIGDTVASLVKASGGGGGAMTAATVGAVANAVNTGMSIASYNWGGDFHKISMGGECGGGLLYEGMNGNTAYLYSCHAYDVASTMLDKNIIGAPVGEMGKVSDFGGFVMMNGASVSASFPDQYIQEANGLIASGIYYE